ncbi:VanW family protein [Cellulomonas sp.]|uniref:VanW family protein n=1 Tax=Cellulomonas sp. TaxID=40001 RepID=UPI00258ECCF8|nr:VanW family protein [Cellulomonas sp.]MCR6687918.1 VanW family protein [Cellulomonas sp.]
MWGATSGTGTVHDAAPVTPPSDESETPPVTPPSDESDAAEHVADDATPSDDAAARPVDGAITSPEVVEPEPAEPEPAEPETAEPDTAEPERAEPETAEPEPEAAQPEAVESETAEPEAVEPEAAEPEAAEPEVSTPEPVVTEPAESVAAEPEATTPEPVVTEPAEAVAAEPQLAAQAPAEQRPADQAPADPERAEDVAESPSADAEPADAPRDIAVTPDAHDVRAGTQPEQAVAPEQPVAPERPVTPEPPAAPVPSAAPTRTSVLGTAAARPAADDVTRVIPPVAPQDPAPSADVTRVIPPVAPEEPASSADTTRVIPAVPGVEERAARSDDAAPTPAAAARARAVTARGEAAGAPTTAPTTAPSTPEPVGATGAAAGPAPRTASSTAAPVPPALAGTAKVSGGPVPQNPRGDSPFDGFEEERPTRRWPRRVLIGTGVALLLVGAYVGASYATGDRVPRGTTVAGVDIGGLGRAEAVALLESELTPSADSSLDVVAREVQAQIDPVDAGLTFDAEATVDGLTGVELAEPARLWHQVVGLGAHEPVTQVDRAALDRSIEALGTSLSQAPVDGAVVFVDGAAQATPAQDGWAVDAPAAAEAITSGWLEAAQPLELPTTVVEPTITQAEADAALQDVAEPLVSAPVSVEVEGKLAVLQPATVAAAASMQPVDGDLSLVLDGEALAEEVVDQLPDGVLTEAADAQFEFKGGKPVVVPGVPGTTVDPEGLAAAVATASTAQDRTATVELTQTDPEESTEALEELGVKEIVSEFSTPLTSETRRTINIAQGLENITGVLVRPGETFSLTEALGPIDAAHGFVQAGAIVNGEHSDAWGGGLSQVSTTTFNAAYFAGMEDVEHTPHSEWFSRYPEGREATIFTGVIDMKWKNTTPYGALLQGWVKDGRAYVRIWGTEYWEVETSTSGRSGVVMPSTVYSDSATCSPQSAGNPGFSVTVTRELSLDGKVEETTSTSWRYKPQNRVVCGEPPSSDDEKDEDEG